jgi:hypothetical protein
VYRKPEVLATILRSLVSDLLGDTANIVERQSFDAIAEYAANSSTAISGMLKPSNQHSLQRDICIFHAPLNKNI